jgi:hypothetical protein
MQLIFLIIANNAVRLGILLSRTGGRIDPATGGVQTAAI